jgi:hypothetical protein
LNRKEDRAGRYQTVKMRDPNKASIMVMAMGLNIFPSIPSKERMGRKTTQMMSTPNNTEVRILTEVS